MKEFVENFKSDALKVVKGVLIFFGGLTALVVGIALLSTDNKSKDKEVMKDTHVEMKVSKEQALINQQKAKEKEEEDKKIQEEKMAQQKLEAEEKEKQDKIRIHNIVIKEQDQDIEFAKNFIKETEIKLKNNYVSKNLIIEADGIKIVLDGIIREEASRKEEAIKLQYSIDIVVRKIVANNMEKIFMENNQGYEISTQGKEAKTLEIKYPLMNSQVAYNLMNKYQIDEIASKYGYKKIKMTDGYDSSYTYDFK